MTLLATSKVLLVGGVNLQPLSNGGLTTASLATAELYDPATGTWSPMGSMSLPRSGHTATLLPNGRVLVAGGMDVVHPGGFASAELYDPATGTSSHTQDIPTPWAALRATLLPNGAVLATGGEDSHAPIISDATELYTPPTPEVLPPSCSLSVAGLDPSGHAFITVAARDILAGLQSVRVLQVSNASVVLPSFPTTFRDPAVVTATKLDPSQRSELTLQVTTMAGQNLTCDPVVAQLVRQRGQAHQEVFENLPQAEAKSL
jgi:hypothetical protein